MRIRYVIGTKCNFKCDYCVITKKGHFLEETEDDFSLFSAIEECKKNNKVVDRILITGGEPCLYKDRVLNILNKLSYVKEIVINTNGSFPNIIEKFIKYDNVKINLSWDGHITNRHIDIYNNIKLISNIVPFNRLKINYVITPLSIKNIYNNMLELEKIVPGLSYNVNFGLVIEEYDYYKKFDLDVLKTELEKLFFYNPTYNIFRKKGRDCAYAKEEGSEYIDIQTKDIYYGCCSGISLYNVVTSMEQMFFCKLIDNDMCNLCKNEFCDICGVKLNKISQGHEENKENFFCIFYNIISDIYYKYKNYREFIDKIARGTINNIELLLTEKCNMNCSYCFEHKKNKIILNKNVIDKISSILMIRKSLNYETPLEFTFFGGETFLEDNSEILIYFLDKLKEYKLNKAIKVHFVTNLFWFEEKIKFILNRFKEEQYEPVIQISLDGIKESNDKNRKQGKNGTFDTVYSNLYELNKLISNKNIYINCVISENTIEYLPNNVIFFDELINKKLINGVSFRHAQTFEHRLSEELLSVYKNKYIDIFEYFLNNKISEQIFKSVVNYNNMNNADKGCGILLNFVTIDQNGNIIPCHGVLSNNKDKYFISNILNPSSFEMYCDNIKKYTEDVNFVGLNNKECNSCKYQSYCVRCKMSYYLNNNEFKNVYSYICEITNIIGNLLDIYHIPFHEEKIKYINVDLMKSDLENLLGIYKRLDENNSFNSEEEKIEILLKIKEISDLVKGALNE